MARTLSPRSVTRALEKQRAAVSAAAIEALIGATSAQACHVATAMVGVLGWRRVDSAEESALGLELRGLAHQGLCSLPSAAVLRRERAPLRREHVESFRASLPPGAVLATILTTSAADPLAVVTAEHGEPFVAIYDQQLLGGLIAHSGVLVEEVPVGYALRLTTPPTSRRGPRRARAMKKQANTRDRRGKAERLFHWRLERGDGGHYRLHGEFRPDPGRSFTVEGELVPPDGGFVPDRSALHATICGHLRTIFPELPMSRVRTKAWAGVHKVYPARVYGQRA